MGGLKESRLTIGHRIGNAVVERFFGRLKHDWIFKEHQPTRSHMKDDVARYVK